MSNTWFPRKEIRKMANVVKVRFTDRDGVKNKLRKLEFDNKEKFELALNAFDLLSKIKKRPSR